MMTEKKNLFEAATQHQAEVIVNRFTKAGYRTRTQLDFSKIIYPCRIYTTDTGHIFLDYTPYEKWGSYSDFARCWIKKFKAV